MKKINMNEIARYLKTTLKHKVSINRKTVITFLMAGFMGLSTVSYADWDWVWSVSETGETGWNGTNGWARKEQIGRDNVILARYDTNKSTRRSVVIGTDNATANGHNAVVLVGAGTLATGSQATALGNETAAGSQATAIGSDVTAAGFSSIAIGSDDIYEDGKGFKDKLPEATISKIYRDNKDPDAAKDTATGGTLSWETFKQKYVKDTNQNVDQRVYSPTYARSTGSIAIGSRSVAYGKGATTLGTLSFALADNSTAIGLRTYADFSATGATAIGEETRVFAPNTIAIGNHSEATNKGSLSFGNKSKAVGLGSVSIGENVITNAKLNDANYREFKTKLEEAANINGDPKVGDSNPIVDSAFGSSNGTQPEDKKKIVSTSINNKFNNFEFNVEKEKDVIITTTEEVKKTKKDGDYGVSLGYYVYNRGDNSVGIGTATGVLANNAVGIGALAYVADKANNSVAIGGGSNVRKENSVSIGTATSVLGAGSVGLGIGALVARDNSVSIGYGVNNKSAASIAIGNGVKLEYPNDEIFEVGHNSYVPAKYKDAYQIGIGNNSKVSVVRGIAIGDGAESTTLANSVALGYKSKVDYTIEELNKPGYTARGSYSVPSSSRVGVISVGSQGNERRIINVASGYRDSDAVTVSQLKTIEDRIDGISESEDDSIRYFSINQNNGDTKELTELGKREINYKNYVKYLKQKLVVKARKADGETINEQEASLVEMANKLNKLAEKADIKDKPENIINLIKQVYNTTDLKNLNDFDKKTGKYWTDVQENGQTRKVFNLALFLKDLEDAKRKDEEALAREDFLYTTDEKQKLKESNFTNKGANGEDSLAIGFKAETLDTAKNSVAIGTSAKVTTEGSVAIGANSLTTATADTLAKQGYDPQKATNKTGNEWIPNAGEFAVGNGATKTRRITGVAAGLNDTDAVNVAQLKRVLSGSNLKYKGNEDRTTGVANETLASDAVLSVVGEGAVSTKAEASKITISLNADKVKELTGTTNLATEYAKADASNITSDDNKNKWREKLNVYTKDETNTEIAKAKEVVEGTNGEIDVQEGTQNNAKKFTVKLSKTIKDKIDAAKTGVDTLNSKSLTFKDGAGTTYVRNNNADGTVTIKEANIDTDYKAENLKVKLSATGEYSIGLKSALTGITSIASNNNANATKLSLGDGVVTLSKGTNEKVTLTGLKDGVNESDAVTKGQLDKVSEKLGDTAKDTTDARNGANGPAGKDGLNGKDVNEKVNALRRGEAGSVVYTNENGDRVVKGEDGNYYKLDDIKDKVYVNKNGNQGYFDKNAVTKDKDGTYSVTGANPTKADKITDEEKAKIKLSLVADDGTTTTPEILSNVASSLGTGKGTTKITETEAVSKINGADGLNSISDNKKLNTVATVGDLQALSIAGLEFKGNTGGTNNNNDDKKTHQSLGTSISIVGSDLETNKTFDNDYSTSNIATKVSAGKIEIGILKTPRFDALELGDNTNKIKLTPDAANGTLTLSKNGTENVELKGLKEGTSSDSAVTKGQLDKLAQKLGDTTKDTTDVRNGANGPAGKDGLNGKDVNEKVNALRRGEAGSVVYTNENGDRVVKGEDGNYYKLDDIKDKVYVSEAGKQGYYNLSEVDKNKDGSYKVKDGTTPTKVAELTADDKAKIRLSLVAEDGTTTTPEILSNVASSLGTGKGNTNTVITSADAKTIVSGANGLNKITENSKLNTVATVGDLQALSIAGLEFTGNTGGTDAQATDKKTHQSLGTSISIVGSDLETNKTFDNDYSTSNVATKVSAGKIEIGILKTPRFDALELGSETNKIKLTPDADANTLTLSKNGTDKVELKGLKEGTSEDSAVTKGQLDKLAQKAGDTSTDKTDKRNGEDGKVGPAGKDGLNGLSVNEKVNALRRGEAGSVVYTNENGDRVVKGEDGNYYKLDDIKDKVYISENGKEGYYNPADLTKNPNGTYSITAGSNPTKADKLSDDEKGKIRLSLVADNGETTTPEILSNVASVLGTGTLTTRITEDSAKDIVNGTNGLNSITDKNKLNTVATVGDLQALSIAGLEFTGNTGGTDAGKTDKKTHQSLGSSISIVGKDGVNSFDNYSTANVATKVSAGKIEIGILKTPKFEALELGNDTNKIKLTPDADGNTLTLSKNDGNDKVELKGLKEGTSEDSAVTKGQLDKLIKKSGDTSADKSDARNGNDGPAGKDGLNGLSVNDKVNALRRGEAGTVVYTNENGDRIVRGLDGKYYKQADIKDKVYINTTGKEGYYTLEKDNMTENPDGTYKVADNHNLTGNKVTELTADDKAKIRLSLVADNGETTTPEILSNVASILETGKLTTNTVITSTEAIEKINGTTGLNSIADNKKLNTVATVGDLQALSIAGLDFIGNTGGTDTAKTDKKTHQVLGSSISIVGNDLANTKTFDNDYSTSNVATKVSANKIEIGILKTPRFDALELGDNTNKIKLTPDAANGTLTLSKNGTENVELKGLKEGTSSDSAVTKGQLDKLAQKAGDTSTDKTDKRNGENGKEGPAGKDGLNGLSVNEKVNALRRGEAGSVVYTNENGDRIVKGRDGKYYKQADIKDKVYVNTAGKEGYYTLDPNTMTDNGDGTYALKDSGTFTDTPATALNDDEKSKIRLSLVADDGTTTTPEILSNVASGIGTSNEIATNYNDQDKTKKAKAIEDAKAINTSLLGLTNANSLNTAATLGDLQAISITGLNFVGNDANTTIHKPLGDKLTIKGGLTEASKVSATNTYVAVENDELIVKFAKKPILEGIELRKDETKDTGGKTITINNNGDVIISHEETQGGNKTIVEEKILTDKNVGDGAKLKYKENGKTAKEVSLTEGLNFVNTTNITASIDENGVVKHTLNENLKAIKSISSTDDETGTKITLGDGVVTLSKGTNEKVTLTGLKDGVNESDAVTKGQLDKLAEKLGETSTDKTDGRNGENGKVGPAGKDGLNGLNVNEKVNALRRGEAGSVVYTDEDGNRLVKAKDGNFYKNSEVNKDGYLKFEKDGITYIKVNDQIYKETDVEKGTPKPNAEAVAEDIKAEINKITAADNVGLSLVNENGETIKPEILRNVESTLGTGKLTTNTVITPDDAKAKISGENGLNSISDNKKLNTAATVGDLQALSIAGLDFTGNDNENVHRNLGTKLKLVGEGTSTITKTAKDNIKVEANTAKDGLEVKLSAELKNMTSFETNDLSDDPNSTVTEKIKLDKDGLKTTKKNKDNTLTESNVSAEGTTIVKGTPDNTGAITPTEKADYRLDRAELVDKDQNSALLTPKSLSFGTNKADADNKTATTIDRNGLSISTENGKPDIELKAGKDDKGKAITPTLAFAKDDAGNGTGVISGLKDVDENSTDGSQAVNKNYVDTKLNNTMDTIEATMKELTGGIAGAYAAAGIPQVSADKLFGVGLGFGHFKGESAVAVGISGQNKNRNVVYKASVSFGTKSELGVSAGVNISLGQINDENKSTLSKDVMARLSQLEEENARLKEKVNSNRRLRYVIDNFVLDSDKITKQQSAKLKEIVKVVNKEFKDKTIVIIGYADIRYKEEYNLNLGMKRARAARNALIKLGISDDVNIVIKSAGYNERVEGNYSNQRRVEILINEYDSINSK